MSAWAWWLGVLLSVSNTRRADGTEDYPIGWALVGWIGGAVLGVIAYIYLCWKPSKKMAQKRWARSEKQAEERQKEEEDRQRRTLAMSTCAPAPAMLRQELQTTPPQLQQLRRAHDDPLSRPTQESIGGSE